MPHIRRLTLACFLAASAWSLPAWAGPQQRQLPPAAGAVAEGSGSAIFPGLVIAKFAPGSERHFLDTLHAMLPGATVRRFCGAVPPHRNDRAGVGRIRLIDVPLGLERAVAELLAQHASVEWAEVDPTVVRPAEGAGDPLFADQWSLSQDSDIDMDVPEAWNLLGAHGIARGAQVVVAVVDTGYEAHPTVQNPDWTGVPWHNPDEIPGNGLDDDANLLVDDVVGWDFIWNDDDPDYLHPKCVGIGEPFHADPHGIMVAGIIAGLTDNRAGIAGVASGVRIMPLIAVRNAFLTGCTQPSQAIKQNVPAAAITYAVNERAHIINNSWDHPGQVTNVLATALQHAKNNGVHVFFAAGNADNDPEVAVTMLDSVITVAAIDRDGHRSVWSNGASNYGTYVDLSAPGTGVPTTTADPGAAQPVWKAFDGTSAACPNAVGVAALVLSRDDDLSTTDLRAILMQGAVDIDGLNPGFEGLLGAGLVNARRSLDLLAAFTDVGHRLPGAYAPACNAWGLVRVGSTLSVSLSRAAPDRPGQLVLGGSATGTPFQGGTLVPDPAVILPITTDDDGAALVQFLVRDVLPPGIQAWFQFAVQENPPAGWTLSNAVHLNIP
jgi:subtilisin family serine protease